MQQKTFGQPKPFGSDPIDSWYGKPDYTTTRKDVERTVQSKLAAAQQKHLSYKPPTATPEGMRRHNFQPAPTIAEAIGTVRQEKVAYGTVHRNAPFGVDEADFNMKYETSSLAGPGNWDQSMASRIARRRLIGSQERGGQKSPTATGSMVPY